MTATFKITETPFALFTGSFYYPSGGWDDFVGAFPSIEAAAAHSSVAGADWWQVVDLRTLQIVLYKYRS